METQFQLKRRALDLRRSSLSFLAAVMSQHTNLGHGSTHLLQVLGKESGWALLNI